MTACIKGWCFSLDPLAWGWVGNRGAFRQESSFLVWGTDVVVFLGLCVHQSCFLQPWTRKEARAEAVEGGVLPAQGQAAALGGEEGCLQGRGQQAALVNEGWLMRLCQWEGTGIYRVSVLHPLSFHPLPPSTPIPHCVGPGCGQCRGETGKSISTNPCRLDPRAQAAPGVMLTARSPARRGMVLHAAGRCLRLPFCSGLPSPKH